jgi:hypothetical protein
MGYSPQSVQKFANWLAQEAVLYSENYFVWQFDQYAKKNRGLSVDADSL